MTAGAMRRSLAWLPAWSALLGAVPACGGDGPGSGPGAPQIPEAALLGGDTTVFDDGDEALVHPLRNLSADYRGPFQIGDGVFNRNWVSAPATPRRARRARPHLQRNVVLRLSRQQRSRRDPAG